MTCSNCGQAAAANDHFCARCGAPFMAVSGPAPTMSMPPFAPAMAPAMAPTMVPAQPLYVSAQESRLWAVAAHLSGLVGAFAALLGMAVGPLAIWLIRRDIDPFAAENAREALNFNLSILLYGFGLGVLSVITFGLGVLIAIPAAIILGIAWIVLSLAGALRAWNDGVFRYPFTIRFIK